MPKKQRHLIDKIVSTDNLRLALARTSRGKSKTWGCLEFKEFAHANLRYIQQELGDGAYRLGPYRQFNVYEPKLRLISALDFKDRLVQHALCNVVAPLYERRLLPQTFACRLNMGTHAGTIHLQSMMRSTGLPNYVQTDFKAYFASIDRARLHVMIERPIGCQRTLDLIREIVPPTGRGLPIGSLTSQLLANLYGDAMDRHIHFDLGLRHWVRYMDDVVVLCDTPARATDTHLRINDFAMAHLGLNISRWHAAPTARGINMLGYRIWHTHKLLRKSSVTRAKRKVRNFLHHQDHDGLARFAASFAGHAQWADASHFAQWLETEHGLTADTFTRGHAA